MNADPHDGLSVIFEEGPGAATLSYDGVPVARHPDGGEFPLLIESGDRVDREVLPDWKASAGRSTTDRLVLEGTTRLPVFTTDLRVTVTYERINRRVVKKTIGLFQNNIPRLFVMLTDRLVPLAPPLR
jgi:hypothetical protein